LHKMINRNQRNSARSNGFFGTERHAARRNSETSESRRSAESLAPVSFYEHVPVPTADPSRRDPPSVFAWRLIPAAFLPHVVVAVPPVVAGHPEVSFSGRVTADFHDGLGRALLYDYVSGSRRADRERTSNHETKESLSNITFSTSTLLDAASHAAVYDPQGPSFQWTSRARARIAGSCYSDLSPRLSIFRRMLPRCLKPPRRLNCSWPQSSSLPMTRLLVRI